VIAKATVERAKAALNQAQAAYDRIGGSSNPAIGASSQGLALQQAWITYQEAAARFNQAINHPTASELGAAIASAEQAKQSAAGARLIAPFDGTVLWVGVRIGESITVGTAASAVADLSRMQVLVNIDEISAASLKVGQSALISVDAFPDSVLKGRISKVALLGTATGNLVTVPVTVDIETTGVPIYPGLSATVEIATGL
jgi:multidrug resistance efflux pump